MVDRAYHLGWSLSKYFATCTTINSDPFSMSQRMRKAVVIARQFHFNYSTLDRSRQEMLNTVTHSTPKAPRHGPRPPSRLKLTEMRQVSAVLFQESSFSSVPSVIQKPICKSLASNRVLFYEDELCQAVAQNTHHGLLSYVYSVSPFLCNS